MWHRECEESIHVRYNNYVPGSWGKSLGLGKAKAKTFLSRPRPRPEVSRPRPRPRPSWGVLEDPRGQGQASMKTRLSNLRPSSADLERVDVIKDLGVVFDSELSFVSHCKEKNQQSILHAGPDKEKFYVFNRGGICYIIVLDTSLTTVATFCLELRSCLLLSLLCLR